MPKALKKPILCPNQKKTVLNSLFEQEGGALKRLEEQS